MKQPLFALHLRQGSLHDKHDGPVGIALHVAQIVIDVFAFAQFARPAAAIALPRSMQRDALLVGKKRDLLETRLKPIAIAFHVTQSRKGGAECVDRFREDNTGWPKDLLDVGREWPPPDGQVARRVGDAVVAFVNWRCDLETALARVGKITSMGLTIGSYCPWPSAAMPPPSVGHCPPPIRGWDSRR
jgi:hypothetical protein